MQLTAWQRKIPRKLSPMSGVVLAAMIVLLIVGGYHLVQWLNPGQKITPRTVDSLEEMPTLIRHDAAIRAIAFNPQPNADFSFVSSSEDGLIKPWHLDKDQATEQFAVQAGIRIALSPDGKLLASIDLEGGNAKVWDLTQRNTLFRSIPDSQRADILSFSLDRQVLASSYADGTIKLWDWQKGKLLNTLKTNEARQYFSIVFSPDGQILAGSDGDQTTKLWNWKTGKVVRTFQGDSIAFSPDGQTLASGVSDGKMQTITLLDWKSSQVIRTLRVPATYSDVAFSPDGQILVSTSDEGIKLWNVRDGKEVSTIKDGQSPFAFSPDGQSLASSSDNGTIKLWNRSDGRLIRELQGRETSISSLRFSPDGQTLIGSGYDGAITLWNLRDGTKRLRIRGEKEDAFVKDISAVVSPDGQTLAIASGDKEIKLLPLDYLKKLATSLKVNLKDSRFVAFSPDQQDLILAGLREIKQLRLKDRQEVQTIHTEPNELWIAFALSPDGQTLATSGFNRPIKLWNLRDGKITRTLQTGVDSPALSVAFSPDGQMLASAFPLRNKIQVWNWKNGNLLRQWETAASRVVFSPDGQLLASGNRYGEVQLWEPQTGKKLRTLKGHAGYINALAFSPDGQTLASGSDDQTIKLWRVKPSSSVIQEKK